MAEFRDDQTKITIQPSPLYDGKVHLDIVEDVDSTMFLEGLASAHVSPALARVIAAALNRAADEVEARDAQPAAAKE